MAQDFTVDRNSPKWVLGADGYLKEYANDEAAIEFNADGSYKGVLVEPESVNEAKASEDLDNATYWGVARVTIAGDTETDPKGGTNSFLLSETVDNDTHFIFIPSGQRPSVGSGETWTNSIFVKKGNGANAPDIIQLLHGVDFGATSYANFDISVGGGTSGTVTASSGGTGRIRYYGNGWYRISFTATSTTSGDDNVIITFTNNNPTATRAPSYAGQTDANVFVWGAQLEQSPIATSYVATTTGAVTRLKDDIFFTNASSVIGQSEGTLFVEVDWRLIDANIFTVGSAGNNQIQIYKRADVFFATQIATAGGGQVFFQQENASGYTGVQKIAFAYKQDDCKVFRNGSEILSDNTVDLTGFNTMDKIYFGQSLSSSAQANMWIRDARIYNTRLTDTQCQDLTTL